MYIISTLISSSFIYYLQGRKADVKAKSSRKIIRTVLEGKRSGGFKYFNIFDTSKEKDPVTRNYPVLPATEFFRSEGIYKFVYPRILILYHLSLCTLITILLYNCIRAYKLTLANVIHSPPFLK